MKEESVEDKVLELARNGRYGKIYNVTDFSNIFSEDSVRKAFQRLEKQNQLIRIARGLYLYPKHDPLLGTIYPSIAELATEIARKEKRRIIPTGQQALLQLGLSTQVPMKSVYLTDGGPRNIKIGNRILTLKPTSSKLLSMKGKISGPVIQAIKALGKEGITEEIRSKLSSLLRAENPIIAEFDASFAPSWIRSIILDIIKANTNS